MAMTMLPVRNAAAPAPTARILASISCLLVLGCEASAPPSVGGLGVRVVFVVKTAASTPMIIRSPGVALWSSWVTVSRSVEMHPTVGELPA